MADGSLARRYARALIGLGEDKQAGDQLVGEGRLLALEIYRVLRLPRYALSLI